MSARQEQDKKARRSASRQAPPSAQESGEVQLECLLCAETISPYHPAAPKRGCQCPDNTCCQACLYRHITSVWEDSLVGGQRPLNCPLGCGQALTDSEVRACLHARHQNWIWEVIGHFIYGLLFIVGCCVMGERASSPPPGSLQSCRRYRTWKFLLHTRQERRDLDRYERWSVANGLKNLRGQNPNDEVVLQHCPAPDCGYSWIVADVAYRRRKQVHEGKRTYLWYKPLPPEKISNNVCNWVEPDFLHFGHDAPPPPPDWDRARKDGRRMVCAKCHYVFCGLCRQPWSFAQFRHEGKTCQAHGRSLPAADAATGELAGVAAFAVGARACPGCQTITSRNGGCNHITCPCGREWCYVCGANWSPPHYGCVDRTGSAGGGEQCVIL